MLNRVKASDITFELNTSLMRPEKLRTKVYADLNRDFEVVELNIDDVLDNLIQQDLAMDLKAEELMIDAHMEDLMDFALTGEKFIPPIIYEIDGKLTIVDGKHRIGLCRHLKHKRMPFLVQKSAAEKIRAMGSKI